MTCMCGLLTARLVYKDLKRSQAIFTNSNHGSKLCGQMKALLAEGREGVAQK